MMWRVALPAGLLALGVYGLTICPTVFVEGSGELIGAAYLLGTAHPTGYPLYCLLARCFCLAAPWTSPALAVNLFTALTAAAGSAALAGLLWSRGVRPWACFGAGLLLAFSRTYWSQAVIAEVYGLDVFFLVVTLGVGLAAAARPSVRRLLLMGFSMGLGLTAHLSQLLVWPGVIGVLIWRRGTRAGGRLLGWLAMGGLAGYSVVLYLPLRAGLGAGFHWGDLSTAAQLWERLSASMYRSSFFALPAAAMVRNASNWLTAVPLEFHALVLPLAILGGAFGWRRDRPLAVACVATSIANLLAVLNYHRDPNGITVFFLPSFVVMAILVGLGLDGLERLRGREVGILGAVLASMAVMNANWEVADRSGITLARDYGLALLADLPSQAVLLAEGDDAAFVIDYLLRLEGQRPDITLYNRQGRGTDLLIGDERRLSATRRAQLRRAREAELLRGGRPVGFLVARHMPLSGYRFVPHGLLYLAVPRHGGAGAPMAPRGVEALLVREYPDPWLRKLQANCWFMQGQYAQERGQCRVAVDAYAAAARRAYDSRSMRANVALALLRCGAPDQAAVHARAALELDPWIAAPYALLARIAHLQGHEMESRALHKRAVELQGKP